MRTKIRPNIIWYTNRSKTSEETGGGTASNASRNSWNRTMGTNQFGQEC